MKEKIIFLFISAIVGTVFFSACGGGGEGQVVTPNPSVTSITSGTVMYAKQSSFTVNGNYLGGNAVAVTASGACGSVTELAGGTSSSRTFACKPDSVGLVSITATAGTTQLQQASFTVPNPQVTMVTSSGTIVVELIPEKAPKTVTNFLLYVNDGFYSNTTFHRVISGFVVQGGGFGADGIQKNASHPTLELEPPSVTGLTNSQGTIVMARTTTLNSATSQFFFNTVDNNPNATDTSSKGTNLDTSGGGYAVFGNVIQGMDTVKVIEAVPVTGSAPNTPVIIRSVTQTL